MILTDKISTGKISTAISVSLIVFLAYFYRGPSDDLELRLTNVINGLIEAEEHQIGYSPKVAVGYGACVDLYAYGNDFVPYDESLGSEPRHYDEIDNYDQLIKSYAFYFQHGAASERYVSNATLFDWLVNEAKKSSNARYLLSGNAPVIANRLYSEGCRVLLGSSLTEESLKAIPPSIKVVGKKAVRDDIHLVIEYKTGDKWGPYETPRSNRYILHNDYNNPHVTSLEEFGDQLKDFDPDLLVISGLQLMDNFPFSEGVRENKLNRIREQMLKVRKDSRVHFEMASFTEEALLWELHDKIIPFADSLGMNEQELANLYSLYYYGNNTLVTDSIPRVATVLDQMREVFRLVRKSNRKVKDGRKLTRLHVHTLAYQAVLIDTRGKKWKQSDVAAAKASLTAYRHVCASPKVVLSSATLLMDDSFSTTAVSGVHKNLKIERVFLIPEDPVSCWFEGSLQVCIAPGLVCTDPAVTAGGGDNISAAALAVQL